MFWWDSGGDGGMMIIGLVISLFAGALCGAVPLTVGLLRGHRQMAWIAFGFCCLIGVACPVLPLIVATVFTIIVAVSEPIEKSRKKRRGRKRRRRERADDFLDDDFGPKRRRRGDDDDDDNRPRRRRQYEDDDDDYDDRRRRRGD